MQYVIEADGSVYPCDFYVLDEHRMGYIQEQTLRQLFEQDVTKAFMCERPKISKKCLNCPFQTMCRGGCKRMKDAIYVDSKGRCGYQQLLQEFMPQINRILGLLQSNGNK